MKKIIRSRVPIPRRLWEVLLRKPKYDYVTTYQYDDGTQTTFINGMLQ